MDAVQTTDDRLERYGTAALVTAGLGGAWTLLRDVAPFDFACPMLASTGIPCPFCGITRMTDHLLHGDIAQVVTQDPGGLAVVVVLAALAAIGVASRAGWSPRRWPSAAPVVAALGISLGVHWATTLAGGGFVAT